MISDPSALARLPADRARRIHRLAGARAIRRRPARAFGLRVACALAAGVSLLGTAPFARAADHQHEPQRRAASVSDNPDDAEGQLLSDVESQNRIITQLVRAEVENALREARQGIERDPLAVERELKLMLARVIRTAELNAEVRAQLRGQLETALREARRRAATRDVIEQQIQQAKAADLDRQRIADALNRDQDRLKQLMDRFDSLMDEGRYNAADEIGEVEVPRVAQGAPIAASASLVAHATGARMANLSQRLARQKAVIDTLAPVEVALIPFPDDQPVVYPDASSWEELTLRRKRYARTDLKQVGPAEKKIHDALDQDTTMEFTEMPLQDAMDYLKDLHGIEIQLDSKALEEAGIGSDSPVTLNLKGISLRSALRLLLNPMDLTSIIKDEVLLITTKEKADTELVTKTYPVADLVIPVRPIGGMMGGRGMGMGMGGGMGGGMMGGMGGGMMGGMGGGMMGGMGGGMMGGMGGGMGGGMF